MKKKKLLVLVLAALSISAVGAAAGCAENHEHSYTWQATADGHYQKCECGDTKPMEDHKDVLNNATKENGKDGKCDVCGYAIKQTVTFNMNGHGTAPATQGIDFGAKASKPDDPEADAYDFLGWYKDADCQTAFDFDQEEITDNIIVYAKWEENNTAGESYKYGYELEPSTLNPQQLTEKGYVCFKYTATKSGRYQIDLGTGINNKKCYFTTSQDEKGTYFGEGDNYASATKYFDLAKDETIGIKLYCSEELDAETAFSVMLKETVNEPLPADAWLDGWYYNGQSISFTIDRTAGEGNEFKFNDVTYSYDYVGGIYNNKLTFKQEMNLGMLVINNYTITLRENGTYYMTGRSNAGRIDPVTFVYYPEAETPVEVKDLSGVYKPAVGVSADFTEIGIKENGSGYFKYTYDGEEYKNTVDNTSFDATYNALYFGNYLLTANVENGKVVSISVFGAGMSLPVTYTRVGDVAPDKLPLESNDEYIGSTLAIRDDYGYSQYWGSSGYDTFKITGYDKATDKYTISVNDTTYVLIFKGEGNSAYIEVYNESGTLLDTLKKYFIDYKELPTAANSTVTMPLADFKKDFYHFEVKTTGWYNFNVTDVNIAVYCGLDKEYPTNTYSAIRATGTDNVYLTEGSVVCVQNLYTENLPANVSFTVGACVAPQGFEESNPLAINGEGSVYVSHLTKENKLYVTFTPSEAGNYLVNVSREDGWGDKSYYIYYTVGGTAAGFSYNDYEWHGGLDYDVCNYALNVSGTAPVTIVVGEVYMNEVYNNVTVSVVKDFTAGATDLPEFVLGTPVAGEVPASVTVEGSGTYKIADTFEKNVVLTSSTEFTAKYNGIALDVIKDGDTYTAEIMAGTNLYVEVSAAVTFTITYEEGSEQAPIAIDLTSGSFSHGVNYGYTYFKFNQSGNFAISLSEFSNHEYKLNGEGISSSSFAVSVGDVLEVQQWLGENSVKIQQAIPADALGQYKGADDVKVYLGGTYLTIGEKEYSLTTVSGNTYTFTAEDETTATLVISGETLTLNGTALTTSKPAGVFTEDQVGTYKTSGGLPLTLVLNADGTGSYSYLTTEFPITVTKGADGSYSFIYNMGGSERTCTLTFNNDGTVTVNDSNGFGSNTFEKEAPPTAGTTYKGTLYDGVSETEWEVTFTLNADRTVASLVLYDPDNHESASFTANVSNNNSNYTFKFYDGYEENVTFSFSGDNIIIQIDFYGNGFLLKQ